MRVNGESLVLVKSEPGYLCFDQIVVDSLVLRTTFAPDGKDQETYEEDVDYVVDYDDGTIHRTGDSRIPDFSTNMLYGQQDFDHEKFPGFSNHEWFVWADYTTTNPQPWAQPNDQTQVLTTTRRKLEAGGVFRIATYGDSITAGGEASEDQYRFQHRFARHLEEQFSGATVKVQDVSIPGYASQHGIDWFDRYMGTADDPDLALVGFGMNDHNIGGPEPAAFGVNLVKIVEMIRTQKGADIILFSAFPPHDDWHYGRHQIERFAEATRRAATAADCGYVDVWNTWEMVLRRKSQSSLLGNNINHPNDFGHWLYARAFEAMRF